MVETTIVKLDQVSKSYRLGQLDVQALTNITLAIHKGEFTALVGASGSGKTTLLNIIGSIDAADSGDVFIQGTNIAALDDDQKSDLRNRHIGFIFQSFNLVPVLSVYENIELPLLINHSISTLERKQRVLEAISDVGLDGLEKNKPDQLSGGQRQRVAVARALAGHPSLVLADEPTANLDSENSRKIIELMQTLNQKKGITFIFSTHDEKLMNQVTRIIRIKDGVIQ